MSAQRRRKLNGPQAAEAAGVAQSTWRAYVARERAPKPDGRTEPCGCAWWWDTTVAAFVASQPRRRAA